jgi:hypothetical protein
MDNELKTQPHGIHDVEIQEWLESLDSCTGIEREKK